MFLKSLDIFGFKSFADRTHIEFADGITSLLGPNGSGKSNIVDSIKWVLGEQSVKSLRASKREDVIFNGTDHRKPMQMAEVTLVLDNEEHNLNIDFPEIEIKRRLLRNGDSEYYLNRQKVLLKNIKDLFLDTGVGKTAYSILEQGKIDQILSNKPEERRYVFEEAAGISRFKAQSIDAQKKIEKTDDNIEQVQNILKEVKKTYDSRKSQMAKLKEYKELSKNKEKVEIELQLSTLQSYKKLQEFKKENLTHLNSEISEMEENLSGIKEQAAGQEQVIQDIRDKKNEISVQIGRLDEAVRGKKANRQIYDKQYYESLQRKKNAEDRAQKFHDSLDNQTYEFDEVKQKMSDVDRQIFSLENDIIEINDSIFQCDDDCRTSKEEIEVKQQSIRDLRQEAIEITDKIRDLASEIVEELQKMIDDSGYSVVLRKETEKAVIDNLSIMSKTLRENARTILQLFVSNPSAYQQKLIELYQKVTDLSDELKGLFQEYCGTIPTFIDELLKPDGIISSKKNLDRSLDSNQNTIVQLEKSIEFLSEKLEHHQKRMEELKTELSEKKIDLSSGKTNRQGLENLIQQMKVQVEMRQNEYDEALELIQEEENKVNENLEFLNRTDSEIDELKQSISQRRDELSEINLQLDQENQKLRSQTSDVSELYDKLNESKNKATSYESDILNLEERVNKIYSDFFDQYGKSLKEFDDHEVTADVQELKVSLAELKQKLLGIPYVNQMAEQEYEEVKTRYDFLTSNLDDLLKAKDDLQEVYIQIKTQSEQMFLETFHQISESFRDLFTRIFAGGKAELNLVEPDNPLDSGIEILAQPPGKKLTYLPLLSGGERSMTAVALLFATYAVKPSPFCILDEIDAALDARNIGYFLSVLDDFSDKSQFIIITHNKNTVMGSKTLLGVTQQEQGVSTMISYKLDSQKNLEGLNLK